MGLQGLATEEAPGLVARLLDARCLPRPDRGALKRLIEHLGGLLLALRLVVPQLHRYGNDSDRVIARFGELMPGLADPGRPAGERGLEAGIAFGLERLEAEHWALLRRLAPFQGRAFNVWLGLAGGFRDEAEVSALRKTGLLNAEPLDISEGAIAFLGGEEPAASAYGERR